MLTNRVILHLVYAGPHTAAATIEIIWKLKFEILLPPSIHLQILPHLITIFSDHSMIHYVDSDLQMLKRSRVWYVRDFARKWKHLSQMASGKLMDRSNKCVEKIWHYVKKITVCFFFCTFCRIKKITNCPFWIPFIHHNNNRVVVAVMFGSGANCGKE
jgi:hypothetical protein